MPRLGGGVVDDGGGSYGGTGGGGYTPGVVNEEEEQVDESTSPFGDGDDDHDEVVDADEVRDVDNSSSSGGANTYQGHPRSDYYYTGSDRQAFERWQSGEISTSQFASTTPPGEGTASLTLTRPDATITATDMVVERTGSSYKLRTRLKNKSTWSGSQIVEWRVEDKQVLTKQVGVDPDTERWYAAEVSLSQLRSWGFGGTRVQASADAGSSSTSTTFQVPAKQQSQQPASPSQPAGGTPFDDVPVMAVVAVLALGGLALYSQ